MDTSFSLIENYPFLSQFLLPEGYENHQEHINELLTQLEEVWQENKIQSTQTHAYLAARENFFAEVVLQYYQEHYRNLVEENLHTNNSFEILFKTLGC